jgi:hypothetical protein
MGERTIGVSIKDGAPIMSPIASTRLEQRVEQIHRLLEGQDAEVTWNDRIPDPDNPNQARQIDVTIRRDGCLTLVECRLHKEPQDVMWIEELIGRRASLRADAVIAVSASGFTVGAQRKAEQFGIILRHFSALTAEEVQNWGTKRSFSLTFIDFSNVLLTFKMRDGNLPRPPTVTDMAGRPINWRPFFYELMDAAERKLGDSNRVQISCKCLEPMRVGGIEPLSVTAQSTVRRIIRPVTLASVVIYSGLDESEIQSPAYLGQYDLGESEIIEAGDRVSAVVDLSQITVPATSFLRNILFDHGRPLIMTDVRLIGINEVSLHGGNAIRYQFQL